MTDIDNKLDAAWRAASREEPPAALDDAIRAAARRAVGAGPSRRARHMRSWPLAAAAVVTVFAVGIVQLMPPEQVTTAIVADNTSRQVAPREQDVAAPAPAPAIDTPASRKQLAQPSAAPPPVPTIALAEKTPPVAPSGAGPSATGAMSPARDRDIAELKAKLEAMAPEKNAKQSRAEPFPAAPAESKKATDAPVATSPPPMLAAASKPAAAAPEGTARVARASRADEAPAAAPPALAKMAPESDRAKDSAPRTPDEWIKLIRRLQSEGRKDDVTKELAAFRAEYKDRADALLPADLRELR